MCFHNRVPLRPDMLLSMLSARQIHLACIYAYTVLLLLLLLCVAETAAIRYRVPDGEICCWFTESDCSALFLFIQARFTINVLLCSTQVAFTASISLNYIFGNYGDARSQGGRQPAAAKPPLYMHNVRICIYHLDANIRGGVHTICTTYPPLRRPWSTNMYTICSQYVFHTLGR